MSERNILQEEFGTSDWAFNRVLEYLEDGEIDKVAEFIELIRSIKNEGTDADE